MIEIAYRTLTGVERLNSHHVKRQERLRTGYMYARQH
jgi:hypothetical protein